MKKSLLLFASAFITSISFAQTIDVNLASNTYQQDFAALADTGVSSVLPTGWQIFELGVDTFDDCQYISDIALSTPGAFSLGDKPSLEYPYFVNPDSTERALGGRVNSSFVPIVRWGMKVKNTETDTAITSFQLTYKGETWYQPSNSQFDTIRVFYSTDADSVGDTTSVTWMPVPALDYIMQDTFDLDLILDLAYAGNLPGNNRMISGGVSGTPDLNVLPGKDFYIMWEIVRSTGATSSLGGVDDIDVTFVFGAQDIDTPDFVNTPKRKSLEASLYPTATTDDVTVKLSTSIKAVDWYITNTTGQRVKTGIIAASGYSESTTTIDVRELASGIYLMHLNGGDDKVRTLKFIKQ